MRICRVPAFSMIANTSRRVGLRAAHQKYKPTPIATAAAIAPNQAARRRKRLRAPAALNAAVDCAFSLARTSASGGAAFVSAAPSTDVIGCSSGVWSAEFMVGLYVLSTEGAQQTSPGQSEAPPWGDE